MRRELPLLIYLIACAWYGSTDCMSSDFTSAMSALNLNKAQTLQQERDAEQQRPFYNAPAPTEVPLTAPQPKRTPVAPPAPGMWMPGMEIKFAPPGGDGSGASQVGGQQLQGKGGQWDASKGMRFG